MTDLGVALLIGQQAPQQARVLRVHDGDTFHVSLLVGDLSLGPHTMHVWTEDTPIRLDGCNAAELKTPAGAAAAAHLTQVLTPGLAIALTTRGGYKFGNDGELMASVTLPDGTDLVSQLIAQQWAAAWNGRGTAPLPPWPRTVG